MLGEFFDVVKTQFVNAINIRDPKTMLGTLAGVGIAVGVVGAVGRGAKRTTQQALEGNLGQAVKEGTSETLVDFVDSQLAILDVISPLADGDKRRGKRRDKKTTQQKVNSIKKKRGMN